MSTTPPSLDAGAPVPRVASPHGLPVEAVAAALGADPAAGLSEAEAARRLAAGPNALTEAPRPGLAAMLAAQLNDFIVWLLVAAALISAAVGTVSGEGYAEAIAIVLIIVLNAVMGVIQEYRAEHALRALSAMAAPDAHVIRDGRRRALPARDVVVGDLVILETGNLVPADGRLVQAVNLRAAEAALTGESVAEPKDAEALCAAETELGDRVNMIWGGTTVAYGRGTALVTATGMASAIGQIADLIQSYEREPTPLQVRLHELGRNLGVITLVICAVVFAVGLVRETELALLVADPAAYVERFGDALLEMFMVAVSLAIAAVPEGLPAVVTIALAIGMQRMVRRHALIRRLPAVETLGSTSTICSDKTGTLTQNEMMVVRAEVRGRVFHIAGRGYAPEGSWTLDGRPVDPRADGDLQLLALVGLLASDAVLEPDHGHWRVVGDPTEGALIALASRAGIERAAAERDLPRVAEIPFDSVRKRMTTVHQVADARRLALGEPGAAVIAFVKGAPDLILDLCDRYHCEGRAIALDADMRARIAAANRDMASGALRVLGLAYRVLDGVPEIEPGMVVAAEIGDRADAGAGAAAGVEIEQHLVFVGLTGMIDPPRPEVAPAIELARAAGVRTLMITGDYPDTAAAIARELGLAEPGDEVMTGQALAGLDEAALGRAVQTVDVFARVSPEHKVRIVEALKAGGAVVAMTGDGVNDAPALRRAHIGVAMGVSGTDVSRETADMVLTDDNYASIVAAIEEGRTIYTNIRKFVFYLLSCNIGEILIIFTAILVDLAGGAPPLVPIQLLWLNLVTDGLPALALGLEAPSPNVMRRPPRPRDEPILSRDVWGLIGVQAVVDAVATLGAFVWAYDGPESLREAQTIAFATLITAELLRAFTSRSELRSIFAMGIFSNRWMVLATASSFLLLLAVLYLPALQPVFNTVPPTAEQWGPILAFALLPAAGAEITKAVMRWRRKDKVE